MPVLEVFAASVRSAESLNVRLGNRATMLLRVAAVALLALGYLRPAHADTISVQALPTANAACGGSTVDQVSTGTANVSVTCIDLSGAVGVTETFTASASIGDFESSVSVSYKGGASIESNFLQSVTFTGIAASVCPQGNGAIECYAGSNPTDPPAGSQLQAELTFSVNGSITGDNLDSGTSLEEVADGQLILNGSTATGIVVSNPFTFTTGTPFLIDVDFVTSAGCGYGACSADFTDPELTDVTVIDPTTGKPVVGLNLVGDDGTVYPTNVGIPDPGTSTVPEPSSLLLLGSGLVGIVSGMRRRIS